MERKIIVEVVTRTDTEGRVWPMWIVWEDGRRLPIDRVIDVRRAASLKAGGQGMRYTVMIYGQQRYLWWEDPTWFVERGGIEAKK